MLHRHIIAFSIAFSLAVGTGAVRPPAVELNGSCADVYHGRVCTWATTQNGHLLEVGATIPFASIENAPKQNPNAMKWPPVAVASLRPARARTAGEQFHAADDVLESVRTSARLVHDAAFRLPLQYHLGQRPTRDRLQARRPPSLLRCLSPTVFRTFRFRPTWPR